MSKKEAQYWVAMPCYITAVTIIRKGAGGRELFDKLAEPYLVEDEDGQEFVVDVSELHNSPVTAERHAAQLAKEFDVDCSAFDDDGEGDEDEENPEDSSD